MDPYDNLGITDPVLLSSIAGRGMNLFPMLQNIDPIKSTDGFTDLYHGTTNSSDIMQKGFTGNKVFVSPDYDEAAKYAKKGLLRGTKYGPVTGDVLKTKVPTTEIQKLLTRGLTGGKELVLDPIIASRLFQQGFGNIPEGSSSLMSRLGRKALPFLRNVSGGFNRMPAIGAASDVLFGTNYTRNFLDSINNLLYSPQQNLQREQEQVMTAGRDNLNQTLGQVLNQQAAARNENRGNYQAPTMTAQQIVQEAKDTGGTVNPFEVTKAAESSYSRRPNMADVSGPSSSSSSRPRNSPSSSSSRFGRFGRADGGMVSLMDLLNRRV